MARVSWEDYWAKIRAAAAAEEARGPGRDLEERIFYLGAHPQAGGARGTPYQPQARVFPGPSTQEDRQRASVYDFDPLIIAADPQEEGGIYQDLHMVPATPGVPVPETYVPPGPPSGRPAPTYDPAYEPSPTMERAISRARRSEGGLSEELEFVGGAVTGAAGELGSFVGSQIMAGAGVQSEAAEAQAEQWRQSMVDQEEELEGLLADEPDLLFNMRREAADMLEALGIIGGEEGEGGEPGRREVPVAPFERGAEAGEALLRGIMVDQGIMWNDLQSYGQAYPLATILSLSPQLIGKAFKEAKGAGKKVKAFQKAVREAAEKRGADRLERLREETESALRAADNAMDEGDAVRAAAGPGGPSATDIEAQLAAPDMLELARREVRDSAEALAGPPAMVTAEKPLVSASTQADMAATRKRLGLPEMAKAVGTSEKTLERALERAKKHLNMVKGAGGDLVSILPSEDFKRALAQARLGERILLEDERFAALMLSKFLEDEVALVTDKMVGDLDLAGKTVGRAARADAIKSVQKDYAGRLGDLMAEQGDLLDALDRSGSAWGRAGRASQASLEMFKDLTEARVISIATAQKGAPLTKKEAANVARKYNKGNLKKTQGRKAVEEAQKAIDDLDEALKRPGANRRKLRRAKRTWQSRKAKGGREMAEGRAEELAASNTAWATRFKNWMGLSRSLNAMLDMSAAGRQAVGLFKEHPILGAKALARSVNAGFFPGAAVRYQEKFMNSGLSKYADRAGLFIADVEGIAGVGGKITKREEAFANNILFDAGLLPPLMRWSERNYNTMLNQIRAEVFDKWTRLDDKGAFMTKKFYDGDVVIGADGIPRVSAADAKEFAKIINRSTGRGDLMEMLPYGKGKVQGRQARWINQKLGTFFFAPRYATSRVQAPAMAAWDALVGVVSTIQPGKKPNAKQIRQMARIAKQQSANMALLGAANMMFDEKPFSEAAYDYFNQDSPEFLSISIPGDPGEGRTYVDTSGGIASTLRYFPSLLTTIEEGNVGDARTQRLITNKVIGPISALMQIGSGRDFKGDETGKNYAAWSLDWFGRRLGRPAVGAITPIMLQEIADEFVEDSEAHGMRITEEGALDITGRLLANFVGLSTYKRDPE